MRADRLVATLLLLQARGRVTAAQVARELEVSERTARRDLDALGMAGVPVYSARGRGGGWSLVGGARTDLSGLTSGEAQALFFSIGPSLRGSGPAAALAPEVKAALRKLLHALPAPLRAPASATADAVVVDAGRWSGPLSSTPPDPALLAELRRAVVDGEQVELDYAGRGKPASRRAVSPLGLVTKAGVWYLVAATTAGTRTFRVSRVSDVARLGLPVVRPDGFDLATTWGDAAAEVEQRRNVARVRADAVPDALPALSGRLGSRLIVGGTGADGRVAVTVTGPAVGFIVAELAGFGARVEVVEPAEARARLRLLAEELIGVYGSPPNAAAAEPPDVQPPAAQPAAPEPPAAVDRSRGTAFAAGAEAAVPDRHRTAVASASTAS